MKNIIFSFLFGLALGITLTALYPVLTIGAKPSTAIKVEAKDLVRQVNQSEKVYARSADSLKVKSSTLQTELTGTRAELARAKQKSRSLQTTIYGLMDKTLDDNADAGIVYNSSCDSLIGTVEYLMQSSTEKDSLYEKVTSNLEEQLSNRESLLHLQNQQYQEIRSAFDQSIENQTALANESKLLTRQVKRQKLKSKVLSAVFLVLSGAAANYFLHR